MSRKDSPQSVIDSYRRRQQMAPYFMAGLAVLLVVVGIIILVVWFTGKGEGRVSPVASLFASPTPTVTETATPTPVTPTATFTSTPTVTMTPTITITPTVSGPYEYTVKEGENCWDIAVAHKVGIDVLLALNNFGTNCFIKAGDKILIPAPDTELPTATPVPADIRGVVEYTVQFGDTLQIIAINFNTTVDAILKENKFQDATVVIKAGDKIKVPANTITATPTAFPTITATQGAAATATETPKP